VFAIDVNLMQKLSSFAERWRVSQGMGKGAGSLREYTLYGQEAATQRTDVRQRSGDRSIDAIGPNASTDIRALLLQVSVWAEDAKFELRPAHEVNSNAYNVVSFRSRVLQARNTEGDC